MGTTITPEVLERIQTEYQEKSSQNSIKTKNVKKAKISFNSIFKELYSSYYSQKSEKEICLIDSNLDKLNKKNEFKNEIEKNEKKIENEKFVEKEINYIIFRKHKSFDISDSFLNFQEILLNENDKKIGIIESDFNSEKDKESNNSDYTDLSKKFSLFNKEKKRNNIKYNKKSFFNNKIAYSYYDKLILTNQWNPLSKEKTHNNIFFFDWDDTLLCTSYIAPTGALGEVEINKKDRETIGNLDILVYKLLSKTLEKGKVFIITNAAPGWIEFSSKKLYPKSAELLSRVRIISARGLYEKRLPGDMRQWKTRAFKYAMDSINIKRTIPTNIVCFGDSIIEIEATYNIKDIFANAFIKTIKFKESPTLVELEKEIKVILSQFETILAAIKNLSIKVAKKKSE